jgi:hypothetical protein
MGAELAMVGEVSNLKKIVGGGKKLSNEDFTEHIGKLMAADHKDHFNLSRAVKSLFEVDSNAKYANAMRIKDDGTAAVGILPQNGAQKFKELHFSQQTVGGNWYASALGILLVGRHCSEKGERIKEATRAYTAAHPLEPPPYVETDTSHNNGAPANDDDVPLALAPTNVSKEMALILKLQLRYLDAPTLPDMGQLAENMLGAPSHEERIYIIVEYLSADKKMKHTAKSLYNSARTSAEVVLLKYGRVSTGSRVRERFIEHTDDSNDAFFDRTLAKLVYLHPCSGSKNLETEVGHYVGAQKPLASHGEYSVFSPDSIKAVIEGVLCILKKNTIAPQTAIRRVVAEEVGVELLTPTKPTDDELARRMVSTKAARVDQVSAVTRESEEKAELAKREISEIEEKLSVTEEKLELTKHKVSESATKLSMTEERLASSEKAAMEEKVLMEEKMAAVEKVAAEKVAAEMVATAEMVVKLAESEAARRYGALTVEIDALEAARKHEALEAARKHDALEAARKHDALEAARKHDALEAAASRKHDALEAARKHDALEAARKHDALEAAASRKHDALEAARKHDALEAARKHDALEASRKHDALEAARTHDALEAARKYDALEAKVKYDASEAAARVIVATSEAVIKATEEKAENWKRMFEDLHESNTKRPRMDANNNSIILELFIDYVRKLVMDTAAVAEGANRKAVIESDVLYVLNRTDTCHNIRKNYRSGRRSR